MPIELPPQYDPKSVEKAIYQKWLDAKAFHAVPDERPPEKRFSMVIPPPNVTGALHLGHAINGTIQDILAHYHRMKGDNTLWMPGIDHAGIATQAVVEKTIFEKEKKSRHDLGREELVRRIWEWKEQFGTRILSQLQSIGASCDWDRTRFTLDEICARAVREAFFKMFKDGLIFRGKRLVNWDTHLQTAVADDEIYHEEVKGQLMSIKYPLEEALRHKGTEALREADYLVVATTRPETMLGDTAVAVHPDDPRYKHLIGGHVIVPLVGRKIPIIADGQLVDPKFGTGVVKVTPAHDPNDYATGQRHNLEQINLLTPDGKVNENGAGEFLGKKYSYMGLKFATAARKQVLADLETLGLIAETKVHEHEVGHSDRSKTPIEPYLSDQWFVRMGDIESVTRPSGSVTSSSTVTRPSGSVERASADNPRTLPDGRVTEKAHSSALAYFITFRTYGAWLHGDEEGSTDPRHNVPGTPFVPPGPKLFERDLKNLKHAPIELSVERRQSVFRTMQEVAGHRGWAIRALNVRSTHVHVVVAGGHSPERMMNDFKSWSTRRLVESSLLPLDTKTWSRHGSTRYLWNGADVEGAIHYAMQSQGDNVPGTCGKSVTRPSGSVLPPAGNERTEKLHETLPYGRVTEGITLADGTRASGLAQAAMDAVTSGRVNITPERYAKGYLDWLGQKRDWCISRQLWWGHRIPVWRKPAPRGSTYALFNDELQLAEWENEGRLFRQQKVQLFGDAIDDLEQNEYYVCLRHDDPEIVSVLESNDFIQDPDVLDTWFSSALWPISTMGWPRSEPRPSGSDQTASLPEGSLPHGRGSDGMIPEPGLLDYFYPTSVLSTARDILTLWVARMVMFGLYCHGEIPFKNVLIHPVIQDGDGRIMSKTKGNGVDPVDIIQSHGADALRFTLASMATETQDIRMPVVKDSKTGINTSPKFDIGRNFANKIWNASRFILSMPKAGGGGGGGETAGAPLAQGELADRWIMSRLNATVAAVHKAINEYRFADYATAMYQFFWSDLCDWYLEIAKSRIKAQEATVQSVLRRCLATSLQLLHPMMPFITEALWEHLAGNGTLLITQAFPRDFEALNDPVAQRHMYFVQSVTTAIREIQNRYPAAKGKSVILRPGDDEVQQILEQSRTLIESLVGMKIAENSTIIPTPKDAAAALLVSVHIFVPGVIDKATEIVKLTKRKGELEKLILSCHNKLGNEAFVGKAPAHIIQGLRDQLAKLEEELAAIEKNLAELM